MKSIEQEGKFQMSRVSLPELLGGRHFEPRILGRVVGAPKHATLRPSFSPPFQVGRTHKDIIKLAVVWHLASKRSMKNPRTRGECVVETKRQNARDPLRDL